MEQKWATKAYSTNSTPVSLDEEKLDEKVVILLQGKNVYDDPIYSYLQLTLRSLQKLHRRVRGGEEFMPSDFGTVLAAGKGEPSPELKSEMAVTYKLIDVPKPGEPKAPHPSQKKKLESFGPKEPPKPWEE